MDNTYREHEDSWLFVATFTLSQEIYEELFQKLVPRNQVFAILFTVFSLLFAVFTVFSPDPLCIIMFLVCVTLAISFFTASKRLAKNKIRLMKQHYDGFLPLATICFGERILCKDQDHTSYYDYAKIKNVYSLKHSYALLFETKEAVFLSRNDFTKGTFEEFKAFLQEKRPDLNIPQ